MDPIQILLALILGFIAIILAVVAIPILVNFAIALGLLTSLPFLWVWEKFGDLRRKLTLRREDRLARKFGLGNDAYAYRVAKRRASQAGISVKEYAERERKRVAAYEAEAHRRNPARIRPL